MKGAVALQSAQRNRRGPAPQQFVGNHESLVLEKIRKFAPFIDRVAHDALAQRRIDLQPAVASHPPDDVAELAMMDLLERVFRSTLRSEGSAFLGGRGRFLAVQFYFRKTEGRREGGYSPLPERQAAGEVGQGMDT